MHLRALPNMEIWNHIQPFLTREKMELPQDPAWQDRSISVFKNYMETFADAIELYRPLNDKSYVILPEAEETMKWESSKAVLTVWKDLVQKHPSDYMTEDEFLKLQDEVKNATGAKGKHLFMPIRVAVIGKPHGAELKILVPLMKKDSLIQRAEQALTSLEG